MRRCTTVAAIPFVVAIAWGAAAPLHAQAPASATLPSVAFTDLTSVDLATCDHLGEISDGLLQFLRCTRVQVEAVCSAVRNLDTLRPQTTCEPLVLRVAAVCRTTSAGVDADVCGTLTNGASLGLLSSREIDCEALTGAAQRTCRAVVTRGAATLPELQVAVRGLCTNPQDASHLCRVARRPGMTTMAIGSVSGGEIRDLVSRGGVAHGAGGVAGGLQESRIINGTLDFFAQRATQEAALFLQRHLTGALCPSNAAEDASRNLLPETCAILHPSGGASVSGVSLLGLPEALRADVESLPSRLPLWLLGLLNVPATDRLRCVVSLAQPALDMLRPGVVLEPATLMSQMGDDARVPAGVDCSEWATTRAALRAVAAVISTIEVARRNGGASASMTDAELNQQIVAAMAGTTNVSPATSIIDSLVTVARAYLALNLTTGNDADRRARVLNFVTALVDAMVASVEAPPPAPAAGGAAAAPADRVSYLQTLRGLLRAAAAVTSQDYQMALREILRIPLWQHLVDDEHVAPEIRELVRGILRFGTLIAAVAAAETTEDVQAALEAASAPLGSYRAYRAPGGAGFISGVVGIEGGAEFILGGQPGASLGVALPIGIEIGGPVPDPLSRTSLNFMLIIFDLGALANARLDGTLNDSGTNGTARADPEVTFLTVLSPGLGLWFGIDDSPFVLGVAAEYLPAGRRVFQCPPGGAACTTSDAADAIRVQALLAIDVPVLQLF